MKTLLLDDMHSDIRVSGRRSPARSCGPWANSQWRVRDVWARGDKSAAELESFDDTTTVSGQRLRELAEDVTQVIDGVFSGFESGSAEPWVVIDAVDSSYYLVRSDDSSVLDAIRSTFRQVSDYGQPVT
ncbi:MAG: hypothetical protein Udaeo2_00500 [Candidatus Udaeobacter sp.]|jgi:hypothetical protein|nr:MAG: hypothetical protein Udaeo2_00500 [Candidatus Udaeobacter sp.]